ncbi:pilin N-terminal domain-containing protein [Lactobacillus sp.]|uniref:pilin N-terminal domain-containing protein n=1 Tax=Lactobacillus sp. TaxID=1591 RepID=UPI003F0CBDDA
MLSKSNKVGLLVALLSLFLAFAVVNPVQAADTGSLTVQMRDQKTGKAISGGNLVVYQVAKLDSAKKYQYTSDFAEMSQDIAGMSQNEIMSANFARSLANYVADKQLSAQTTEISSSGDASINLESNAVYLVVQTTSAAGYEKINPFCLVLPYTIDGQTVNNIVAQPKDTQKTPSNPATPNTPSTPSSSSSSNRKVSSKPQYPGTPTITAKKKTSKSNGKTPTGSTVPTLPQTPRLPQTGQLNWPIPLFALAGLTLFVWGWADQKKG